ncbi:acyl-CoA dehydrogenase [Falsigemmobacter faecalis]|uniref:3-methylmercaptopropionyl-CoA dehydrogenase n=1 Tax=Falsigemmobacter faecalis TaxID=2488730 RepID=A0A3P3DEU2_9RHOB|nr:acyl-CoA dehydrogenase [Falsigemmobacter faecalis]RRH72785.1 acyl-CoA dehydrogenase [Falsigemmobacter faecalis]
MSYKAPLEEVIFALEHIAGLAELSRHPGLEAADPETARAVLAEAGRLCEAVIAPLNAPADRAPSTWSGGEVSTSAGFKEAWGAYVAGGWQGLSHPEEFGGQALPKVIGAAATEMLNAANLSFALCPLLTDGAIEALLTAGSEEMKALYLPKLIAGTWTGTMNLTEPQAGSDLALLRTRAERTSEGSYRIFGTKIFITYGEHDLAENICHLVLARTPDAPAGVRGISLFLVPKYLPDAQGNPGSRNDVHCTSIEHKLGIKASPTAVLQFGDHGGAVGFLIGEENRGLEYMFVMMNAARFAVGMQGVALSERALQQATAYARDRIQSRPVDGSAKASVAIIHHPDIRRLLMKMRALTEGGRALAYYAAALNDRAHHGEGTEAAALYELLVPLVKGFCTENAVQVASDGLQIHGGMGFIEETGAAQHLRDARILPIYEGTTAIQANDFLGRKILRDSGRTARVLIAQIMATEADLAAGGRSARDYAMNLGAARKAFEDALSWSLEKAGSDPNAAWAGSVPLLMLAGNLVAGWQLGRGLLAAEAALRTGGDEAFLKTRIAVAQFYAAHLLPEAALQRDRILYGAASALALAPEAF